jgi:hypothetical protein
VPEPESHAEQVWSLLDAARAGHAELLERVGPELRASLPVDATGMTQAIAHLAAATGTGAELEAEQAREHRANPAVLHGRVFGRAPLAADTVLAAFVDGARVRAALLLRLAETAGGPDLRTAVAAILEADPPPAGLTAPDAVAALRASYAAQERAVLRIAAALDATR